MTFWDNNRFGPVQIVAAIISYAIIIYIWMKCDQCCHWMGCCRKKTIKAVVIKDTDQNIEEKILSPRPLVRSYGIKDLRLENSRKRRKRKRRKITHPDDQG